MCVQTVRRHMCRHCSLKWTHTDGLELCPEGDKVVLKHGYCAPVIQLLAGGGHHVSIGRLPAAPPPPPPHAPPVVSSHHHHQQGIYAHQQQHRGSTASSASGGDGGVDVLLDMCEDCKEKHYRDWAIEVRIRQSQQLTGA